MMDDHNLTKIAASAIRNLRLKAGISQEELASRSNVDRSYMSAVERGTRNFSLRTVEKIIPHICESKVAFFEALIEELK